MNEGEEARKKLDRRVESKERERKEKRAEIDSSKDLPGTIPNVRCARERERGKEREKEERVRVTQLVFIATKLGIYQCERH